MRCGGSLTGGVPTSTPSVREALARLSQSEKSLMKKSYQNGRIYFEDAIQTDD